MKLLFISSLLSEDYHALKLKIVALCILYIVMLVAIFLDLISGIRKAKKAGEYIASCALRRTVDKSIKYFNLALIFTLIDIALSMLPQYNLPYATGVCALLACVIEIKSVYEKYEKKEKAKVKDAAKILKYVLENKEDVIGIIQNINELNKNEESNEEI